MLMGACSPLSIQLCPGGDMLLCRALMPAWSSIRCFPLCKALLQSATGDTLSGFCVHLSSAHLGGKDQFGNCTCICK